MEDLKLRELPKWPQMYTTGKPVALDQAKEIIRRTDKFFTLGVNGNDKEFIKSLKTKLSIPFGYFDFDDFSKFDKNKFENDMCKWRSHWNPIQTQYVHNDWVSSCFSEGPHGWCHPDGTIGFVDNIGKWPTVESVYDDWVKIAKEFTFLEVGVTLMNCESSEAEDPDFNAEKVVSFFIKDGSVEILNPDEIDVHKDHDLPKINKVGFVNRYALNMLELECGIKDKTWFDDWEKLIKL